MSFDRCVVLIPATDTERAALLEGARWTPGEIITISFLDGDSALQQRVQGVIERLLADLGLNLTFEFRDRPPTDIRISFEYDGSWSLLGRYCRLEDPEKPTMSFGWLVRNTPDQELQRVVRHEFGHALGMLHEHQNPQDPICWNVGAVTSELSGPPNNWDLETIVRNVLVAESEDRVRATTFDPKSIMMYPIPKSWLAHGDGYPANNHTLSEADKSALRRWYS